MSPSLLALTMLSAFVHAEANPPLLLQRPAVSSKQVVFAYAGDLWLVERGGGNARRLTDGVGLESYPVISPDGSLVAFAGDYEGNLDVYVIPATGGVPRRLTHHPDPDVPVNWTPDGQAILFRSTRASYAHLVKLFRVPVGGGQPTELPLPMGEDGSLSADAKRIAYVPLSNKPQFPGAYRPVRNYRGGSASPLWIADLADSSIVKVPRTDSNDFNPMWIDNTVYFLSDRDGPTTLFAYDPGSKQVRRVLDPGDADIKSASACGDAIVYDRFGTLHLYDLKTEQSKPLSIRVVADLPGVRSKVEKTVKQIHKAGLSPSGVRAVFEARGEVLTVPADKGDVRNLTNTSAAAERDPAWSPDGKWLAYLSDESGEYELHVRGQDGRGKVKKIRLGGAPSFYYNPTWSPDGKRIAYQDKRMNTWYVDLDTGNSTKVDTAPYDDDPPAPPAWSPDGKWLVYSRSLKNYLYAVFLHSLETGKSQQITDGMSDARHAVFDKGGKYLYFTASTDIGPAIGSGMSTINRGVTRNVYVVVLSKEDPSPLAPESDDEKPKKTEKDKKDQDKSIPTMKINLEDLDQRTLALPLPSRNYLRLIGGKAGTFFLMEGPTVPGLDDSPLDQDTPTGSVLRFDLSKRKAEKLVDKTTHFAISDDGEKLLYHQGEGWFLVGTGSPAKAGDGALKLDGLEIRVDPRAEWRQIYREVYRIERDFLYDANFHGYDLKKAWTNARSLSGWTRQSARLELLARRTAGGTEPATRLSDGRRRAEGGEPQVRAAGCGLPHREWTASLRQSLSRRKLEPQAARAAHAAGSRR